MQAKIKGGVVLARRAFVVKTFGEDAWKRVVAALPPADRAQLQNPLAVSWFPFAFGERLDRAIVDVVGGGDSGVFERLGAESARENLRGTHRFFLKPGNPQGLLERSESLYQLYYDQGRRTYEPTGPSSGVLTTYDADIFSAADCMTVVGWYKEALRLSGASDVEVVEEICRAHGGAHCRYRLSWRMDEPPPGGGGTGAVAPDSAPA